MVGSTPLLSLLALPLLAAGLSAQGPPPFTIPDVPPDYYFMNWPSGPGWAEGLPFGETVSGEFTDLFGGDFATLRGERVFVLTSPEYVDAITPLLDLLVPPPQGFSVTDIASSRGTGPLQRDVLVSLGSSHGLVVHPYDAANNTFGFEVVDASTALTSASQVLADDVNGDGETDLLVASGSTVRTYLYDAGSYTAGWTFAASGTVQDMVVLDYDSDGSDDLAVISAGLGVEFFNQVGPAFPPITYPSPRVLTKISRIGMPGDWLALVFRIGSVDYLLLKRHGKMQRAVPLKVPAEDDGAPVDLTITSVTTGDYDDDGFMDLICAHEDFAQNVVLYNLVSTSPNRLFGVGEGEFIRVAFSLDPATSPVPENQGSPAFWSDDELARNLLVYPLDSLNGVGRTRSPQPETDPPGAKLNTSPVLRSLEYSKLDKTLTVHFTVPGFLDLTTYDYLQFGLWHQEDEGGFATGLAIEHVWYAWPPSPSGQTDFRVVLDLTDEAALDDIVDEGPTYWIWMRLIDGGGPGNPVVHRKTQSTISGWRLAPEEDPGSYYADALRDFPHFVEEVPLENPDAGGGQSEDFGVCVVTTRMPQFSTNDPLDVPAPSFDEADTD